MEEKFNQLEERLRAIENSEASCRIGQDFKVAQVERKVQETVAKTEVIETRVDEMAPWIRGLRWALGIIGAAVLGLVWGLLTGQVQITVK